MTISTSQRIVDFIANLLPLYVQDSVDGMWCARSLEDGTLIQPMVESDEKEDGWVKVHWQGDASRASNVQGVFIASVAVARYVEIHHTGTHSKDMQAEMERYSQHFTVKTGQTLTFESPESGLLAVVGKAVLKVGESAVVEILKKQVGL